jgi:hypothetical protein
MSPKADDSDNTCERKRRHARRMLNFLRAEQEAAAPQDGPTDVADELSAMADAFILLRALDEPARRRALDWLHQRFDDAPLRF